MQRPFTFINCAMSLDGKISTKQRHQVKISGHDDFMRMDSLRSGSDAIMVGIGTVLADDPSLTVKSKILRDERVEKGFEETPVRIIVDSLARTPLTSDIFKKGQGQIIIATSRSAPSFRVQALQEKATIITAGEKKVDLQKLALKLHDMGIKRLMVEGGATLNWGLISKDLVDEIYTFIGNMVIGGTGAPTPVDGAGFNQDELKSFRLESAEIMDAGIVLRWSAERK
ncbi:2,5-diamino-6-hydroxy-4-(5-phosphoribosylamino)pyrimidine1-reductase [Methanosalsum zhilinae DSM 4017]|uniref:2,5-diamino-6-(ribosylamino)-4(3H)-pyrimidinone 5'-phosphate reductase n=1 Tax=Methanosalsum zhilinae (strain DSM 4017 / NBRC 107636 / OCM 62 / WeN5) TaxID=679901 RepID=F7XNA8_METZD|nr:2,5-diamino-6-(ribosylamino)-4(3H)-pyrimidinone 5'-phosphate reductase [Methanosalsum zhilinae]AEH60066.1 2,5-diamino-6-hydroxy-4-(5-phosphoribosylamino)pyrimidine1-reductase [Methanosalsum zhilinae DSM 4017]